MNLQNIEHILSTSTQNEWIVDDESGSFTYKEDVNLRIERANFDTYQSFNESWATNHPDSSAQKVEYLVKYNSSFIKRYYLVSVDGSSATLPMPTTPTSNLVRKQDVNFAKIVNISNSVDEYLNRSGLTIEDS